ncbi:aromatic ring-hydroxylating dioxygenase subunit alpha [Methylobacillus caricis]|uniref:aromatic ring-hydroxylating oxygenase subunit alpha n=1 Tax=Methylobacillus caricis TaxID=1971611 RepID=UPI001CFFD931|nr:aromatic ring-hydroxylating dioxygenase subunit alpha [Methylobacillus caricis]MCB5187211.1 aromatic ring-hydroxylating dioxygenase subunit alpha [Methylobacillus caricis]
MVSLASVTTLPSKGHSQQFGTQLPVSWYTDPAVYALEAQHLFPAAPKYIGHELMVPETGSYHALEWMDNAKALIRNTTGIGLISNVCRHRQAIMLKGRGKTKNIICPLHRWTYSTQGELLGAPHFDQNPCLHLNKSTLQNWGGLLFESKRDIAQDLKSLGCKQDFDFTGYMLNRVMVDEYNFNWKTFIEVYLEDYHVGPFHPGLGNFVDCEELNWEFGDWYSVQTVGVHKALGKSGSLIYQEWQEQVLKYGKQQQPKYGAIWMVYYPFLMIEWYPNVLVVSHIIPRGPDACTNVVEFYYPEDIALFEEEFVAAQQAAYTETAIEDMEICQRMHDGRRALASQDVDERGPYQHPMETGMQHFHAWLHRQLDPYIKHPG